MGSLLEGFNRVERTELTPELRANILNNIGCLASMAQSVNEVLGVGINTENDASNLAFTAALVNELIGELNGLLQQQTANTPK